MTDLTPRGRRWLLTTAKAVARQLALRIEGTRLRIRMPRRAARSNTDGWSAVIGDLGRGQPRLEVWYDRFSGYPDRKLYACLRSEARRPLIAITKRVSKRLWPVRVVTSTDTSEEAFLKLDDRLARSEFNAPVLEKYVDGRTFYGIYDPTRATADGLGPHFRARAVAFFEDVARALPRAGVEDEQREVYLRVENRRHVASHLLRERSKLLAVECKTRDSYRCQVCGFRFEDRFGKLGKAFAEAHHRVPLHRLREGVPTRIEDLVTVCANCHRMLHRMAGHADDVRRLRALVRSRR